EARVRRKRRGRRGPARLRALQPGAARRRSPRHRSGAAAARAGDDGARPRRQGLGDRRAVHGDQGGARRVLADRGARPQRGRAARCRDPARAARLGRGPARGGLQPAAPALVNLDAIYRAESRRVRATLIRLVGSFDAAEEALHEAFVVAAEQWPRTGVPANPYAWLVSTGRFKMIDRWRRQARHAAAELPALLEAQEPAMLEPIPDDELRLIFTCCHPALAPDARVALTL